MGGCGRFGSGRLLALLPFRVREPMIFLPKRYR